MWGIRLTLLGILFALVGVSSHILRHRSQYESVLESRALNLLLVVMYNLLCYLTVGLPSAPPIVSAPNFLDHQVTRAGLSIVGQALMVVAAVMLIAAVIQRKALGGQDAKSGLLTSGVYRYCRHPIYTGIVLMSLGLPLTIQNLDGLLVFPGVFLANVAQATAEERWDIGARFRTEYEKYRRKVRMLGPLWFWAILVGLFGASVGVPHIQ